MRKIHVLPKSGACSQVMPMSRLVTQVRDSTVENSEDSQFFACITVGGRYDMLCWGAMSISMAGRVTTTQLPEETTMTRQMRRFMLATAVLGLMAGAAAPARADISLVFTAAGTFTDGAVLGGTMTIDTTNGTVTSAALTVSAPDSLNFDYLQNVQPNFPVSGLYALTFSTTSNFFYPLLSLGIPTSASTLQGYTGGNLASDTNLVGGFTSSIQFSSSRSVDLDHGTLTVAVPEPSTLLVACVGGVCAIAYGVANKRRAARNTTSAA